MNNEIKNTITSSWKQFAAAKSIDKADIAALCIYRAILSGEYIVSSDRIEDTKNEAVRLLKKSFSPVSNQKKLQSGRHRYQGLLEALSQTSSSWIFSALPDDAQNIFMGIVSQIRGSYNPIWK